MTTYKSVANQIPIAFSRKPCFSNPTSRMVKSEREKVISELVRLMLLSVKIAVKSDCLARLCRRQGFLDPCWTRLSWTLCSCHTMKWQGTGPYVMSAIPGGKRLDTQILAFANNHWYPLDVD